MTEQSQKYDWIESLVVKVKRKSILSTVEDYDV
jgi:hypothetical protein